jgi:uncharacterized membrane protein (UPF0127 family)/CheY-like chemotaxis protein
LRRKGTLTLRRDDGRIVCETVVVADRWGRRLRGLLGRRRLPPGEGLLLRPSFSIHTAFMRFPIDAVFLDHDLVVLKIDANLRPFRTSSCRGAREVVELSAGECARRGLAVGDRVAWASQVPIEEGPGGSAPDAPGPRGRVVLASDDARFVKLARFLLDGRRVEVAAAVSPERLGVTLEREDDVDAVVLDARDAVTTALTTANAARALRPDVPVIVVGETRAAERAPAGVRIYDKWNQADDLLAAVDAVLGDDEIGPEEPPLPRSA